MASLAGTVKNDSIPPLPFKGHATQTVARASACSFGTAGTPESIQSLVLRSPAHNFLAVFAAAAMAPL